MSYTPTEWESTDVVTATRMNALEQAVGDMNMSYTPNVWSDGDILSADKMNVLEQAVASGGGGSSDFTTAEVTVNTSNVLVQIPYIISEEQGGTVFDGGITSSGTYTVPLYKGMLVADYSSISDRAIAVTGSIVANEPMFVITGDCTITVS